MSRNGRNGALILAVMAASACSTGAHAGPIIQFPAPVNHVTETLPRVDAQTHISIGSMLLCLSGAGSVKVIKVEPDHPVGRIRVADFGLRPNPLIAQNRGSMLGTFTGKLAGADFVGGNIIDIPCGTADSGAGYELGIEFTTPDGAGAGAQGWTITYESAGQRQTFLFPLTVIACPQPTADAPECVELGKKVDPDGEPGPG